MAYDEKLAQRCDVIIQRKKGFSQMRMFGGVGFLLKGNMCFGVYKDYLIVRLGQDLAAKALKDKNIKEFDITGRAMKGWAMVNPNGTKTDLKLQKWINSATNFVKTLPPKI
jgi:TfoX/Sxy family transcriptional regulator of competence genes